MTDVNDVHAEEKEHLQNFCVQGRKTKLTSVDG
jgi:hypothetical protein